jgi:hypothetical protein
MNGYRFLGYVVWRAGKWYLRRKLPSRRTSVAAGLAALGGTAVVVLALRRLSG